MNTTAAESLNLEGFQRVAFIPPVAFDTTDTFTP
jgi:hypothetical protein